MPGVQEEFRENCVETEKNRDKSSNCDVCVTCDDVRCLLYTVLELNWCCAILLFDTFFIVVFYK